METVAEWVGDETTAQMLADSGIDYLQGYHFGMPLLATAQGQPVSSPSYHGLLATDILAQPGAGIAGTPIGGRPNTS